MLPLRYTHGGDEHIFVEIGDEMSLDAFFTSLSITGSVRAANIKGVTEICPANASFQIKYDPDVISAKRLERQIREFEADAEKATPILKTRVIEVPVYYQDPWTYETLMRFRDRHQDSEATDIAYAARINGYASVDDFIQAHSGAPWFVSMVGFVAGLPFLYQMVERKKQIQVPKYVRPRTDTPKQTVGYGGCFSCIYSVRGAGGYQMFGITPMPIYDPTQKISYLKEFMVFFRPGDIVWWRSVNREEYDAILADVKENRYEPKMRDFVFSLTDFSRDIDGYNKKIKGALYGD